MKSSKGVEAHEKKQGAGLRRLFMAFGVACALALMPVNVPSAKAEPFLETAWTAEALMDASVAKTAKGKKRRKKSKASPSKKARKTIPQKEASSGENIEHQRHEIPPEALEKFESETLPDPSDPLDRLYGRKRLARRGVSPVLTVGLMSGKRAVTLVAKSKAVLSDQAGRRVDVSQGTKLTFSASQTQGASVVFALSAGVFSAGSSKAREAAVQQWKSRGMKTSFWPMGSRFAVRGKMVDTRKDLLVVGQFSSESEAMAEKSSLEEKFQTQIQLHRLLSSAPQGQIQVEDSSGKVIFSAATAAFLTPVKDDGLLGVNKVEFAKGYAHHGFQDRTYRGQLAVALDVDGALSVVNVIDLESYLRGIVPSEIFPRSHSEALKAQAVTARGEVLAKLGTRHLSDPFHLCGEQHCQVYSGVMGEAASTDAAVKATEGELLFDESGKLVDSTYSAVCGGHTEDNDVVWGTQPDGNLRGRWDVSSATSRETSTLNLKDDDDLRAFLTSIASPTAFCATASLASSTKFRWEKRFSQKAIDEIAEDLGVGHVRAMRFSDRGISGRASTLTIEGDKGVRQIRGELNIRRKFQNLNSTMAVIKGPKDASGEWIFRGGGWGHGVGMCQIGAIGRAEAGQSYREILGHYFGGAQVEKIYGANGQKGGGKSHASEPSTRGK